MATQMGLPVGWIRTKIGEVYRFTSKPRGLNFSEKIDFIPMEAISESSEWIDRVLIKKIGKVLSGTYVENGDLIVAKITPSFENGKQGIVDIDFPFGYATTEVIPIQEIKDTSDKWFLAYWLRQLEVRSILVGKMEGSTGRQRLSKTVLFNTEIVLPPLPEQKAIARILTTIQEAIAGQEALIAKLKELKKSMMHYLFTHGTKGEKTKMTEIGEIPESWEVVALGNVCKFNYGKNLPESRRVAGNIPVYGSNGIVGCHDKATIELPGIIIGRKGSAGLLHFSRTHFCPIDTTFYITAQDTSFDITYLFYLLEKLDLRRLKADVGVPGISREMAYREFVAVSNDPKEQAKIARKLDLIKEMIECRQSKLSIYQNLLKALLYELMSGKQRV